MDTLNTQAMWQFGLEFINLKLMESFNSHTSHFNVPNNRIEPTDEDKIVCRWIICSSNGN